MTRGDLAQIKQLLAHYRAAVWPPAKARRRKPLETELVRHADALIAAAENAEADILQASSDRRMAG